MASNTETVSTRLPEELLDKIDKLIEDLGFSGSRAEYIADSLSPYFRLLVASRLKIDKQVDQLKSVCEIDPTTILSITSAVMKKYMDEYLKYNGKRKQVLIRVPVKLMKSIEEYCQYIGLYSDRSEFIRCAVSNQVEADTKLLEDMERVRNHKVIQTRSTEEIINSVLNDLQDPTSNSVDGMVKLANLFIKESAKPKNP